MSKRDVAAFFVGWSFVQLCLGQGFPWWLDVALVIWWAILWVGESGGAQHKLLWGAKDGGPESKVWMWGIESKRWGSLFLLKFADGSREAYHTHAFNSLSWVLSGTLDEFLLPGKGQDWAPVVSRARIHTPHWKAILTLRTDYHKVYSNGTSWVLSLRGPWSSDWREYLPEQDAQVKLTHGRTHQAGCRCPACDGGPL